MTVSIACDFSISFLYNIAEAKLSSNPWIRKKQERQRQMHARFMQIYGESLKGKGHGVKSETTVVTKEDKKVKSGRPGQARGKSNQNVSYIDCSILLTLQFRHLTPKF